MDQHINALIRYLVFSIILAGMAGLYGYLIIHTGMVPSVINRVCFYIVGIAALVLLLLAIFQVKVIFDLKKTQAMMTHKYNTGPSANDVNKVAEGKLRNFYEPPET